MKLDTSLNAKDYIIIKGARVHNLKNIEVAIPKNKLITITGLSGSGKSSLAFDTLYAEGQRRYIESLSSYARQFLGKMNKPEVDFIHGIAPCIAIEQKVNTSNPRSTVGTSTEIYDYLKLFFARIGRTISPLSGNEVQKHTVTDVVNFIVQKQNFDKVTIILTPLIFSDVNSTLVVELELLRQKGFSRVLYRNKIYRIDDLLLELEGIKLKKQEQVFIVVDRFTVSDDEDTLNRISDSIQTAFSEGFGECWVEIDGQKSIFSNRFELDGMSFELPSPNFFSFNNSYGACKTCEGLGVMIDIDEDLVIPDKKRSVYDDAVACWRGINMGKWKQEFVKSSAKFDFPIHRAYGDLTAEEKELLWKGNAKVQGIDNFFGWMNTQIHQLQYRVILSRYKGKTQCKECRGSRLRKDASYVKINNCSITDLVLLPIEKLHQWFLETSLTDHEIEITKRLLVEIKNRLNYLCDVGLGYLTLNRLSNTLSGGESQRINLATSLGSSLMGSIYVLDEPSIGLHPRDTHRLIKVLESLRDAQNTVVVVEHEEEVMRASDYVIDIGPLAGVNGGEVMYAGEYKAMLTTSSNSLTAKYLRGEEEIQKPNFRRTWNTSIEIKGAYENNLKNVDVKIPLHILTIVTGVSGSGKTTLIKKVLVPALQKQIGEINRTETGKFEELAGDIENIKKVELVDQNPIGRSSRSNPVSYIKAWDDVRELYAKLPKSKQLGLKVGHFSFNVEGGRCDECEGEGEVTVSMQFMADINLICESCQGKRFKQHILDVTYKEKNVYDLLNMTVDEALEFFREDNKIYEKIKLLSDVGLGYIKLGQSSNTLSGGEAQRVKLASFLLRGAEPEHTLFVFDEPTTGLHFHDINKLMKSFQALIAKGASIIIIEHNMDVIKSADWIIDLGPDGGEKGGNIMFEGTPEDMIQVSNSYTAQFLKAKF